jgi:hypothetical protein
VKSLRRHTALIAALVGCLVAPASAAMQTFLPPGGYALTTNAEVHLPMDNSFTVVTTGDSFFLLATLLVSNHGPGECRFRARMHSTTSVFPDQIVSNISVPGSVSNIVVQIPLTETGLTLGLGMQTVEIYCTKTCGAAFDLSAQSYNAAFGSNFPGGSIVAIGPSAIRQSGSFVEFDVGTAGTDFNIDTEGGGGPNLVWNLPDASLINRGAVTIGAQTFGGFKTFGNSLTSPGLGAQSQRIGTGSLASATSSTALGVGAQATGASDTAVGHAAVAAGGGSAGVAVGDSANCGAGSVCLGATALGGAGVVALGAQATAVTNGTAVGSGSNAAHGCLALGADSTCDTAGDVVLGSSAAPATTIYGGVGKASGSPVSYAIEGTNGSGANVGGGKLLLKSGLGTGTGLGGGVRMLCSPHGSSGSALNGAQTGWDLDGDTCQVAALELGPAHGHVACVLDSNGTIGACTSAPDVNGLCGCTASAGATPTATATATATPTRTATPTPT